MAGTLNNGMCRCCASEGSFRDISSKYVWMGEEEIYAEMLRECFDINLVNAESHDGGICEVCITQLRSAANFKKQVQITEEQFKKRINDNMFKNNIVKVEVNMLDEDDHHSDNNDNNLSDDFSGPEFEVPVKTESEEVKGKKRTRATAARTKKAKLKGENDNAESSKRKRWDTSSVHVSNILKQLPIEYSSELEESKPNTAVDWTVTIKTEKNIEPLSEAPSLKTPPRSTRRSTVTKPPPATKAGQSKQPLNKKAGKAKLLKRAHFHNIRQILLCTNATPIKHYDGIGYQCCFCDDQCPTPAELKKHVLDKHEGADLKDIPLPKLVVKLDVTDFKCTLCDKDLENLEGAVNHLKTEHNKLWYETETNQILMFKYNGDGWSCPNCFNFYVSFKMAISHMRTHYHNHICNICGVSYITQRTLQMHVKVHETGEYACSFCDKVFDNVIKKNVHEKFVHITSHARNKCPECHEKFVDYKKKLDHMAEVHGREPVVLKCLACDKIFANTASLRKHTRRHHLMERTHECKCCEKMFFSKNDLEEHMLKHTGEKRFKCDVCSKCFGRKYTLREHMRIHADERRFKCEFCDRAFVQKCSLNNHLRSRHKDILNF